MSLSGEERSPQSIFVIVADLPTRALICLFFQKHGLAVIEAGTAEEAEVTLHDRHGQINFVIADLLLGNKSGPDTIRALFGEESKLPRVFLFDPWSYVPPRLRSRFPVEELIEKPVSHRKLAQVLGDRLPGLKRRGGTDHLSKSPVTVGT